MKKLIMLSALFLILFSCGKDEPQPLETRMIDGKAIVFVKNGSSAYSGPFSITSTNPDGTIYTAESGNYKNGLLDGEIRDNYNNGKIRTTSTYKDGVLNGIRTYYNMDGTIDFKENYEEGALVNPVTPVENGYVPTIITAHNEIFRGKLDGKNLLVSIDYPTYEINAHDIPISGYYNIEGNIRDFKGFVYLKDFTLTLNAPYGVFKLFSPGECEMTGTYQSKEGETFNLTLINSICGN